jgi:hypothetical protein
VTFSKLGTDTDTQQFVYLPKAARTLGLYIIGIQGTGKSGLIENLIMQDVDQQIGVCVLDPHGELIEHVIARLDPKDEKNVILLDLEDYQHPFGLNLFACPDPSNPKEVQKIVDQVRHIFEKLLGVSTETPLILEYLVNCTYTLIANQGYTMAEIPLLLTDKNCRQQLVANVQRLQTRLFWRDFDDMPPVDQRTYRSSIIRRVGEFLQDLTFPIVGQSQSTIDLQKIMQEGIILLVKLSAQVDSVSSLIGSLMIALLLRAAYNRPDKRRQFHLYADEFQRFATEDFATLLEEARKFGIATTIAHQNRGQLNSANSKLETDLKDRSRSVGNLVVFKINSKDADDLAGEFDTTPPPPTPEEKTRRAIQTPVRDVMGHLLNRGGHTNFQVNRFVGAWRIADLASDAAQERRNPTYLHTDKILDELNDLLYNTMVYKSPDTLLLTRSFLSGIAQRYGFGYGGYYAYVEEVLAIPDVGISIPSLQMQTQQYAIAIRRKMEEYYKNQLLSRLEKAPFFLSDQPGTFRYADEKKLKDRIKKAAFYDEPYDNVDWLSINPSLLQWHFVKRETVNKYLYTSVSTYIDVWELVKGQEHTWYTQASLAREINRIIAWWGGKEKFDAFITGLYSVMKILAVEPIEADSGRQEIVMRPGTVRPFADVKNDIANQLSGLTNFTARVKLGTNAPQNPGKTCLSCGLLNNPGVLDCVQCQTKIIGANEYTITTIKPAGYIGTQQLDQRIKRIQARNIQQGYLRDRTQVETEIIKRQTSCSGSPPAQPQLPPQQPRHARQVPLQGNCQNCGASNSPGSKFCNQCGAKL